MSAMPPITPPPADSAPHILVVGNEKGGTGKSTIAFHIAVALMDAGLPVATLDLDGRQGSLTRYIENRCGFEELRNAGLPIPLGHRSLAPSGDAMADARAVDHALAELTSAEGGGARVVVVDTPGSDSALSRRGHAWADTLITPLNDSLVDLDVLALVDVQSDRIVRPSHYAAMVWEAKQARAQADGGEIQWIVLRNRLSNLNAHNKREMARLLGQLGPRLGFTLIAGLSERVIFRELFLAGLTLLDLRRAGVGQSLTMSHITARNELRALLKAINLGRRVRHEGAPPMPRPPGAAPAARPALGGGAG
ncbi:division plane positioning ATPase MipZ [Roseospirillum parvum]|uniref:Chromosome partitioning protein n=1 Tax=Roseospirillum parvum TaxID=83401 RepID=A0A1G7WGN6_9PROT|nr:division plane positioning ATPase MipZ [Roseospirillum parvum]SDG71195.1 chromosome partitioning protein [Roseospirillum parvum]